MFYSHYLVKISVVNHKRITGDNVKQGTISYSVPSPICLLMVGISVESSSIPVSYSASFLIFCVNCIVVPRQLESGIKSIMKCWTSAPSRADSRYAIARLQLLRVCGFTSSARIVETLFHSQIKSKPAQLRHRQKSNLSQSQVKIYFSDIFISPETNKYIHISTPRNKYICISTPLK